VSGAAKVVDGPVGEAVGGAVERGNAGPWRQLRLIAAVPAKGLIGVVRLYQLLISPLTIQHCRYYPSCSTYAVVALRRFGLVRGLGLAGWRLLRCNPFSRGGVDHVPERHGATQASRQSDRSTAPHTGHLKEQLS
jgi:putative membrane protein insertion efficiency factor